MSQNIPRKYNPRSEDKEGRS